MTSGRAPGAAEGAGVVSEFKYEPWIEWKDFDSGVLDIPIDEPPCKHCKWFRPRVVLDKDGNFDGVRLCHTPKDQYQDFSCYHEKDGAS